MSFSRGRVFNAFYIQPASGVFCLGLVIFGVITLLSAVFGVRFAFLDRPFGMILKYLVVSGLIVVAGGWAVTLSRAMAAK